MLLPRVAHKYGYPLPALVVELAGVNDPEAARRLIGKTALLEFKLVEDVVKTNTVLDDINSLLKTGKAPMAAVDTLAADSTAAVAVAAAFSSDRDRGATNPRQHINTARGNTGLIVGSR